MKGVSSIIVIIILLLISISIIGFVFVFFTYIVQTSTEGAEQKVTNQTQQFATIFQIESVNGNEIFIRNTGTAPLTNLAFFVNGIPVGYTGPQSLAPDEVGTYILNSAELAAIPNLDASALRVTSTGWSSEIAVRLSPGEISISASCIDTDSDMYPTMNYNTNGMVTIGSDSYPDACLSNTLKEAYCQDLNSNAASYQEIPCGYGCSNGACIIGTPNTLEITGVYASDKTGVSIVVKWKTNELSNSSVKYGTSSGAYTNTKGSSTYVIDHSVLLSGLSPNTTYYIAVNSTGFSGNTAQSDEFYFTTSAEPPVTLNCVDTDSEAYPTINYNVSGTVTIGANPYTDTCINGNQLKEYYCINGSDSGNASAGEANTIIKTCSCLDGRCVDIPPVISNVYATNKTAFSIVIKWTTDTASTSVVKYGTSSGIYTQSASNSTLVIGHSIQLGGLSPNTTYYIAVNSTDTYGNSNQSDEYYFTTGEAQYVDADFTTDSLSPDIVISPACDQDLFNCRLMKEIAKTHRFLQRNENGLPYTEDPRTLTPESESIRLVIDTQANGYLNLYKMTSLSKFLTEAENRLDYILLNKDSVLQNNSFNGQVGYTFLSAYELDHKPEYLQMGLDIAQMCIGLPEKDKILNWGLMCAMDLAKAYKITNNITYLNEARKFVRNTMTQQYEDGSFPHQYSPPNSHPPYGNNYTDLHYTSWMVYELNQIRSDDPQDPDIEASLIKANDFMTRRVNDDGSLNFSYIYGAMGWTNELAYFGYDLKAMGENGKSEKALRFLFQKENTGNLSGSYPDKWGYPEDSVWASSNSSIVRTSIIFWILTSIPLIDNSCQNGLAISCTITPSNCNSAFGELNSCGIGASGTNVCISGRFTNCLNQDMINYTYDILSSYPDPYEPLCTNHLIGYKKCISSSCTGYFYNAIMTTCLPYP